MLRLDEWRRARNISQKEMAKALNISLPTYIRLENNPENIKIGQAFIIAKRLDVSLDDIIFVPMETTKCGMVN
jgi:transcriptional regulator with XRE-family HTH domain